MEPRTQAARFGRLRKDRPGSRRCYWWRPVGDIRLACRHVRKHDASMSFTANPTSNKSFWMNAVNLWTLLGPNHRWKIPHRLAAKLFPYIDVSKTKIWNYCPNYYKPNYIKCVMSKYSRLSGDCNDVRYPEKGSSGRLLRRMMPNAYADGENHLKCIWMNWTILIL
jgi:hypothetical protein